MALLTLKTRWEYITAEKAYILQTCQQHGALMAAGPRSANEVTGLAQRMRAGLNKLHADIVPTSEVVALVSDYADAQLVGNAAWTPGSLPTLLAGLTVLAEAVIAQCRACIPRDGSDRILKDTWNADGSVTVLQLQPADTAALRTALDTLVSNIPE